MIGIRELVLIFRCGANDDACLVSYMMHEDGKRMTYVKVKVASSTCFVEQVLHFRPQITWLKDGIELNSFSEHEHVSFDLSSFFFSSCLKLFKL